MMKASINGDAPRQLDDTAALGLRLDAAPQTSGRIRDGVTIARGHLWRSLREGWLIVDVGMGPAALTDAECRPRASVAFL